jgi:hypothetical protein
MNWKPIAVFVAATAAGFLLQSHGPLGSLLWPMAEGTPEPEGANLVLLMVIGGVEAAAFGLGVCFLVWGMPWVRKVTRTAANGVLLYLSVAWLLVNWVPHTSLHMAHGNILTPDDFGGLVAIEYGFHLTLVLAGAVIAYTLMRFSRSPAPAAAVATAKAKAS